MQIAEKYKKYYEAALQKFYCERDRMYAKLATLEGIRVIPSQANYFMLEIKNGMTAKEVVENLLAENIFIKDLSGKAGIDGKQYVRVAVRKTEENDLLIKKMESIVNKNNQTITEG